MNVILEENHQGHRIRVGEEPRVVLMGRSPVRQWSYQVHINEEDVSEHLVAPGQKPDQLLQNARQLVEHRLSGSLARE